MLKPRFANVPLCVVERASSPITALIRRDPSAVLSIPVMEFQNSSHHITHNARINARIARLPQDRFPEGWETKVPT